MLFSNENVFKITEKTITLAVEGYKIFLQNMCKTDQQLSGTVF